MPIVLPPVGGVGHTRLYMHRVLGDFQFQRWIVVSRRVFSSVFEPYELHNWEFSKFMVNAITGPPTQRLHWDWAHPGHIHAGLTPARSAPGLNRLGWQVAHRWPPRRMASWLAYEHAYIYIDIHR